MVARENNDLKTRPNATNLAASGVERCCQLRRNVRTRKGMSEISIYYADHIYLTRHIHSNLCHVSGEPNTAKQRQLIELEENIRARTYMSVVSGHTTLRTRPPRLPPSGPKRTSISRVKTN